MDSQEQCDECLKSSMWLLRVSSLMQLGYTFDEKQIARDFWYFLRQFYAKYPKYAKLDLYVIGESYGEQ